LLFFILKNSPKLQYEKNEKKNKKKHCKGEIYIQKLELLNKILCTGKKYGKTKMQHCINKVFSRSIYMTELFNLTNFLFFIFYFLGGGISSCTAILLKNS
jgi:hypothetical protein